jgi:hypothetical protein
LVDEAEEAASSAQAALAAEALADEPATRSGAGTRTYYLAEHKMVALLEERANHRAVLTVETEAPELAGARIRFTLGPVRGELILTPTKPPGAWRRIKSYHMPSQR